MIANAEATLPARTLAFTEKLNSLTHKPDADANSQLETWDVTIRSVVAYQGTIYRQLLPNGRETLTAGTYDARLDAGRDFAIRLRRQTGKATLIALGETVGEFYTDARALRTTRNIAKTGLEDARLNQEPLRLACAAARLNMVGVGLQVWKDTPELVDSLFDVALLRGVTQAIPTASTTTTWTPATRRLSTTALPNEATRLEAWRQRAGWNAGTTPHRSRRRAGGHRARRHHLRGRSHLPTLAPSPQRHRLERSRPQTRLDGSLNGISEAGNKRRQRGHRNGEDRSATTP